MPIIKKTPISRVPSAQDEGQIALDVYQTKDKIIVLCPVAGIDPNDISISITDDVLTIKGERQYEDEIAEKDYYAKECYWGSFSRSIILPSSVDKSRIEASFNKQNILRIEIPRLEEVNTKSIRIKRE